MAIDLYQSRRAKFNRCEFFKCVNGLSKEELIHKATPSGIFYAVEVSPKRGDGTNVAGVARFDRSQISIETDDDVDLLAVDDIVNFKNQPWIVVDIQFNIAIKRSEFSKSDHGFTVINLRR